MLEDIVKGWANENKELLVVYIVTIFSGVFAGYYMIPSISSNSSNRTSWKTWTTTIRPGSRLTVSATSWRSNGTKKKAAISWTRRQSSAKSTMPARFSAASSPSNSTKPRTADSRSSPCIKTSAAPKTPTANTRSVPYGTSPCKTTSTRTTTTNSSSSLTNKNMKEKKSKTSCSSSSTATPNSNPPSKPKTSRERYLA